MGSKTFNTNACLYDGTGAIGISDSLATYGAIEMCFDWLIEHLLDPHKKTASRLTRSNNNNKAFRFDLNTREICFCRWRPGRLAIPSFDFSFMFFFSEIWKGRSLGDECRYCLAFECCITNYGTHRTFLSPTDENIVLFDILFWRKHAAI